MTDLNKKELYPKNIKHDAATNIAETSRHDMLRANMIRRLVRFGLLALLFMTLMFLLHDMLVKNQFLEGMEKINRQINEYVATHNHLPSQTAFSKFELKQRNISLYSIHYDVNFILDESPGDTVLAYTHITDSWFLPSGHAVLYLNGNIEWVSPRILQRQIEKRNQLYQGKMLKMQSE